MANNTPCTVIGVHDGGPDLLTPAASRKLADADLIIADDRFLKIFNSCFKKTSEQRSFKGHIKAVPKWVATAQKAGKQVVVLATGDPLFHGIAVYIIKNLPPDSVVVMESATTIQVAFSRLGIAWNDARLISIHHKDGGEWTPESSVEHPLYQLHQALLSESKIAILTSPANSPNRIAKMLEQINLSEQFSINVAEALTTPQEKISTGLTTDKTIKTVFKTPNIVILLRISTVRSEPVLGSDDSCFLPDGQNTGLITKQEVRAISLAYLALKPDSIVWDIGAGSGSVGLEAARLVNRGCVYAIEKNEERVATIKNNQAKLRIANYQLTSGFAPEGLSQWPAPDGVFIGGSGGSLEELIPLCAKRLNSGGRLVMNFISLENLNQAMETLKSIDMKWKITQVQINKSQPILEMNRLVPEASVFIVVAYH
ncbi:MAG: precorrin-6y C5,15-methyltransferase (decarboxylating) subunit CbiE [Magnetococcales bacterium]|nr:precorrin-6y C5,15-methyltransferase (decarboxylating) subunit CbiE [Magnetococcales bacterium]